MLLRLPDHDTCWKLFIFFGVRLALSTRGGKLGCSEFQFQIVTTAPSGLQRIPIVLRSQGLYMQSFAEKSCKINARHRTLARFAPGVAQATAAIHHTQLVAPPSGIRSLTPAAWPP
jgi:hypothetical protein